MIDRNKFNRLLNAIGGLDSNFTLANGPFPARKACAVCPSPSGGGVVSRPVNFAVVPSTSGCGYPQRRWNANRQIPAVSASGADWVTCFFAASGGNQIPAPSLWHIRTDGPAPVNNNAPQQYWVEVQNIGYGY